VDIVKTRFVLHSFVRVRDCYTFQDALTVTGLEDVQYLMDNQYVGVNSEQCKE
jgi:hypothetical protein